MINKPAVIVAAAAVAAAGVTVGPAAGEATAAAVAAGEEPTHRSSCYKCWEAMLPSPVSADGSSSWSGWTGEPGLPRLSSTLQSGWDPVW